MTGKRYLNTTARGVGATAETVGSTQWLRAVWEECVNEAYDEAGYYCGSIGNLGQTYSEPRHDARGRKAAQIMDTKTAPLVVEMAFAKSTKGTHVYAALDAGAAPVTTI